MNDIKRHLTPADMVNMEIHFQTKEIEEMYRKNGGVKTARSVGFDLVAAKDTTILGKTDMIPLGVVVKPKPGHFILVTPRSSTYQKYGIMLPNSVGVIDPDYCGSNDYISFPALNFTGEPVFIPKGAAIGQALLLEYTPIVAAPFTPYDPNRGGFGSTDKA